MLNKRWAPVFALLVFLALPAGALALQSVPAVEYGPWTDWQREPVPYSVGLDIEKEMRTVTQDHFEWQYSRYVYFNTVKGDWFASPREQEGPHYKAGSGKWEQRYESQPLAVTGQDGDDLVYEGGWFNEEVTNRPTSHQQEMYRSRTVRKVSCEVTAVQLLLFPDESRDLEVKFYDGGQVSYLCLDNSVAAVDQMGRVTGHAVGATQIIARSSKGREAVVEVLVCQQKAQVPGGIYTLRLLGSTKALAQGESLSRQSDNLVVKEFTGERTQRFVVEGEGTATFMMHPLNHKKWFVDINRKDGKIAAGSNVQTHQRRDRGAQYWRAVYVPDGSYILYPKAEPKLVLGARSAKESANVRLEPLEQMDQADRWLLVKDGISIDPETPFARPMARDGAFYVKADYGPDHPGIDFGSGGKRAYVLSAARGTVIEADDTCRHDYAKAPGMGGGYIDPCGADSQCPGKYVLIDHGGGVTALYAHLSSVLVKPGDSVRQGSILGRSGATGSTPDVKLYFEMRMNGQPTDPREYIKLPEVGKPIQE